MPRALRGLPTTLLHGNTDGLLPTAQAHLLDAALNKQQIHHQLVVIEDAGHGSWELNQ